MITINGRIYKGTSLVVVNNRVTIDGKDVTDEDMPETILAIKVDGDLHSIQTDASVVCENVTGDVVARGSVSCGSVHGNVESSGSVSCDDVGGNVKAGGSVSCDDVGGSVEAGGSISHG